ncbi:MULTISPECIES: DNA methyltransferase [unclassified Moraxella]|uniref:DNA methyltransferase n=1 Tax=unclassified Moraxella TaxID=2685852 RepID=UPI00359E90AF
MQYLIEKCTRPNATILDCFMGSGSTCVACVGTGRNFIGIELDDHYFSVAKNRINNQLNEQETS